MLNAGDYGFSIEGQLPGPTRYRINWKSTLTGEQSHGGLIPKNIAEAYLEYAAAEWPELIHWMTPED